MFFRIRPTSVKCRWPRWPDEGFRQGCVAPSSWCWGKNRKIKRKTMENMWRPHNILCLACPKLVDFYFQSINRLAGFGLSHFRRRNPLKPLALGVKRSLDPYSTCFRVRNRKYTFFLSKIFVFELSWTIMIHLICVECEILDLQTSLSQAHVQILWDLIVESNSEANPRLIGGTDVLCGEILISHGSTLKDNCSCHWQHQNWQGDYWVLQSKELSACLHVWGCPRTVHNS